MESFEYFVFIQPQNKTQKVLLGGQQVESLPQTAAVLSALGAEGWDFVAVFNGVYVMRRPTP